MYSILLVDDEPRQVKAMQAIIQRLKPAYTVLQAEDGESALKILSSHHVDIVISDIRMPGMDGIELMNRVGMMKQPLKLVLLTGHDDFQYAIQAIRSRAFDYLLKPIGKPELVGLLERLEAILREEQAENERLHAMESKLTDMASVFEAHLLSKWIMGKADRNDTEKLAAYWNPAASGILIVSETNTALEPYKQKLEEQLSPFGKRISFPLDDKYLVTALLPDKLGRPLEEHLRSLMSELPSSSEDRIIIGISPVIDGLTEHAPEAFSQVCKSSRSSFYLGACCVIPAERIQPFTSQYPFREDFRIMESLVRQQDLFRLNMALHDHLEKLKAAHVEPDRVREEWILFLTQLQHQSVHIPNNPEYVKWISEFQYELRRTPDIYRFKKTVMSFFQQLVELGEKQSKHQHRMIINQCIKYLDEHYYRDLSLEETAQRYHFHPSYFSTVFKTVTGTGFSEYMQKLRIGKAKAMILNTDDKISDISLRVGFRDAAYFTRIFKKETGVSPNAFKRICSLDGN